MYMNSLKMLWWSGDYENNIAMIQATNRPAKGQERAPIKWTGFVDFMVPQNLGHWGE